MDASARRTVVSAPDVIRASRPSSGPTVGREARISYPTIASARSVAALATDASASLRTGATVDSIAFVAASRTAMRRTVSARSDAVSAACSDCRRARRASVSACAARSPAV